MSLVPIWRRPYFVPTGRTAASLVVCFAPGPLRDDVPMRVDRYGVSSVASIRAIDQSRHERAADEAWFDAWRSGALRRLAIGDLGADLAALDAAVECVVLRVPPDDPPDLAHLQSIWALLRWYFERGATVALDGFAMSFLTPRSPPAPDAAFDVKREVRVVFETDERVPGAGHVIHTRGLGKVARPEVVAACSPAQAPFVAEVLWEIADGFAQGRSPGAPRQGVDLPGGATWFLTPDEGGRASSELELNNDARILVDAEGSPLVSSRLRV